MELKQIKNDKEYQLMLEWVDSQFDNLPSPDGDSLQRALLLVKTYEDLHYKIPSPYPADVIKL